MRRVMLWTAASAILAFHAGPVMARGEGGGGERGAGEVHGGEGAHVGADHAEVHVAPNSGAHVQTPGNARVAPRDIPHEGDHNAIAGHDWRYRYDNGAWWYWLPTNRWSYYDNGAWQEYTADNATTYDNSTPTVTADVPSDPNYYWYNNQWWYWLPGGNRWSYYDHGGWREAEAGKGPQRRETGYRGVPDNGANAPLLNNNEHQAAPGAESHGPVNAAPHIEGSRDVRPTGPAPEAHGLVNVAPHSEGPRK